MANGVRRGGTTGVWGVARSTTGGGEPASARRMVGENALPVRGRAGILGRARIRSDHDFLEGKDALAAGRGVEVPLDGHDPLEVLPNQADRGDKRLGGPEGIKDVGLFV